MKSNYLISRNSLKRNGRLSSVPFLAGVSALLFLSMQLFSPGKAFSQVTVQIGTGTSNQGTGGPIYSSSTTSGTNARHVILYTQDELAQAGIFPGSVIRELAWYKSNDATLLNNATSVLKIYQRSGVSVNEYSSTVQVISYTDTMSPQQGWTLAGSAAFDANTNNWPSAAGWMSFPVTPFEYKGGGLELYIPNAVIQDAGNVVNKNIQFRALSGPYRVLYTGRAVDSALNFTRNSYRSNIQIVFSKPVNNAVVSELVSPVSFCPGRNDLKVALQNTGGNVLDSVEIHWELNGVAQPPVKWTTRVDTLGSAGGNRAIVTLRSNMDFPADSTIGLKAWVMMPNGISVPVRGTDTFFSDIRPGLNGVYTVGGSTPDFNSFADAVQRLNASGVCGPVVFRIRSGVYDGNTVLSDVSGVDNNNTITFRSETGNRSDVRITNAQTNSDNNYVVRLRNVSNVTFKNLTLEATGTTASYTTVLEMGDTTSSITIDSCDLKASKGTGSSGSNSLIYAKSGNIVATGFVGGKISVTNSHLTGGGVAFYLYGASSTYVEDIVIDNNRIDSQGAYGFYLYYVRNIQVTGNNVVLSDASSTSTQYGGYIYYAYDRTNISGNYFYVPGGTGTTAAAYGLYFYFTYGTASQNCSVFNNALVIGGQGGTSYGIYCNNNANQKIYNNSVHMTGGGTGSYTGYFNYTNSTYSNNTVYNNVFVNSNGGRGVFFYAGPSSYGTAFDYNNVYTTGTVLFVTSTRSTPIASELYSSLTAWRAATGFGRNSLTYPPAFRSNTDLRPDPANAASWALNGRGIQIAGNNRDINGAFRSADRATGVPDIGAFEFTPAVNPPLATADPATPAAGATQVFTFGEDTVARIVWDANATAPATVDLRQYSGTVPPGFASGDSMYFYVSMSAPAGSYLYDGDIYFKDPWLGTVKSESSVRMIMQETSGPWTTLSGSVVDTGRSLISDTSLSATGLFSGTGEQCSGQPLAPVIITPALTTTQCPGSFYTLKAQDPDVTSGIHFQWEQAPTTAGPWTSVTSGSGGTTLVYNTSAISSVSYFRIRSICVNSGQSAVSAIYEIPVVPAAQLVTTTDASRCGVGSVTLSATGSAGSKIYWYDAPTGGVLQDTGTNFTTPVLNATTTYWAAASDNLKEERLPSPEPNYIFTNLSSSYFGVIFVVNNNITINTVDIYPRSSTTKSATVTVNIRDMSNNVLASSPVYSFTSVSEPQLHVVPVNISLPPGQYKMVLSSTGVDGMMTAQSSNPPLSYPFTSPSNAVSVLTSANGSTTTNQIDFKFFFNWSISVPCESPRQAVTATLGAAPAFSVSATPVVCNNDVATLTVTSPAGNYDSVRWSPVAGLFTDAAGTIPYTGGNTRVVYARTTRSGLSSFIASSFNTVSKCGNVDTARVFVQPAIAAATASPSDICVNGSTVLRLDNVSGFGPGSVQWQTSPNGTGFTDIPGAISSTYATGVLNTTTYFRAAMKNSSGSACVYAPVTVTVNNTAVNATTPATRCGPGSVVISAAGSAGATMRWYNALSGGTLLDTGNSFTTPFLTSTTSYYVSALGGKQSAYIGKQEITTTRSSQSSDNGLNFDVYTPMTLESVAIYPIGTGSGTVTIELRNSSNAVLQSTTVTVTGTDTPGVKTVVPLNFSVPVGAGMKLMLKARTGNVTGLLRESAPSTSADISYPYILSGIAAITGGTSSSTGTRYYQYFYDWHVSIPCESPRMPVTATITPAPPFTPAATPSTVCAGDTAVLSGASANTGYSYEWTPGSLIGDSVSVSPAVTTKYYVTALDRSGGANDGCVGYDSVIVNVNALPNAVITASGDTTFCEGDSVLLFASTGVGYTYAWSLNGIPVSGSTGSILASRTKGDYRVSITDGNSCVAVSAPQHIEVLPAPEPEIIPNGQILTTGSFTTYQWYRNGVLVPGATGRTHTPDGDGDYTVVVSGPNGCFGTSPVYRYNVGIRAVGKNSVVKVYPNPAGATVYVDAPVPVNVTVISADGKTVLYRSDAKEIDISRLADAVYMVRVTGMDGALLSMVRLVKATR